jgi:hypothetical protein
MDGGHAENAGAFFGLPPQSALAGMTSKEKQHYPTQPSLER